ncbi:hypothetical protein EWM64_g3982 [Hericium alpestre]|uniref:KN homeodomain domain-containing protein n=1 Tax=Hericium alpestre TaxID=135208 RepID=A0A4Z0A142_9AGAM|nr:hypothetical protein EWM64_g3982 [Hericium alpestre]
MVQTLQSRFLAAEEHFLAAFTAGPQAMAAFDDTWTSLSVEFKSAMNIQQVDSQTSRIADTVASRIAILSEHLLALHSQVDTLSTTFKSRCLDILSCANADPPPTAHAPSVAPTSPTVAHPPSSFPYSNSGFGVPSLDMLASQWLLANLHDPYPSSFLKNSWASSCGCSVKDVQVWFAEARQHIGWTALAREKFAGCRRDTSEVASRAYSEDQGQLNLPCDVRRAFTAIRTNADRFVQSISSTPNDIKPEEGFSMGGEDLRTPQRNNLGEVQKQFLSFSDSHHPSPIIVSSSLSDGDEEEDTTPPPSIAGHKRRLDRSDNNMQEQAELLTDPRPTKRHRYALYDFSIAAVSDHSNFVDARLRPPF